MHPTAAAAPNTSAALSRKAPPVRPQSATHAYARTRLRDPLANLLAIALRHRGGRLPLSSFAAFGEGLYMLDNGESPYHTRRAFLRAVEYGAGTSHPDYEHAWVLVNQLDDADAKYLGVAA